MNRTSYNVLRVGMAITFLWIGILIFKYPEAWGGYLQPWAAGLLPVPIREAMIGTAILDVVIGACLLVEFMPWLAAIVGAIHLVIILIVSGITDITVRDIGLLVAMVAIVIESLPKDLLSKVSFLRKTEIKPNI